MICMELMVSLCLVTVRDPICAAKHTTAQAPNTDILKFAAFFKENWSNPVNSCFLNLTRSSLPQTCGQSVRMEIPRPLMLKLESSYTGEVILVYVVQCSAVQCVVCSVKGEICIGKCEVCSVKLAVGSQLCSVCSLQCRVFSMQCAMCSVQCAVCSV